MPRHTVLFSSDGRQNKVQDTPKENNLICKDCEKGFNLYETFCAFRLKRFDALRYRTPKYYRNFKIGSYDCFTSIDLNIKIFNLFIYSIIWRASAADSDVFKNFKLLKKDEEILRHILKQYTSINLQELQKKLDSCNDLPAHRHFIFRPNKKLRTPDSGLYLRSITENFHHLGLVDYGLFYYTDKNEVFPGFEHFNNNRLEGEIIIGLLPENVWRETNFSIIQALLQRP